MANKVSANTGHNQEKDLTLSEHLGVLVLSVVLFFGGGALIVWANRGGESTVGGKIASVAGGILALIGLITGMVTIQGILKTLWRGVSGKG